MIVTLIHCKCSFKKARIEGGRCILSFLALITWHPTTKRRLEHGAQQDCQREIQRTHGAQAQLEAGLSWLLGHPSR